MTTPLKTADNFADRADETIGLMTQLEELKAQQATELDLSLIHI